MRITPELQYSLPQKARVLANQAKEKERLKQFEPVDTRVYRYRSFNKIQFYNLGSFYFAKFSNKQNDSSITREKFTSTYQNSIFCFVLEDPDFLDDWKKAKKYEFKIGYKIDFEKFKGWYEDMRKKPFTKVSPVFIK